MRVRRDRVGGGVLEGSVLWSGEREGEVEGEVVVLEDSELFLSVWREMS